MITHDVPLLCLPFAGAGASFFLPWRRLHVAGVEVLPLQLPGRERLLDEEPHTDLHAAADALLPVALELIGDRPVAVFGHCLGSVLAYELAHRIADHGRNRVLHLYASASRAPWNARSLSPGELSDDDFLDLVQDLTGYRHPAFEIPEMRDMLLPTLRADFQMYERYAPDGRTRLAVPITAFYATEDTLASADDVSQWRDATSDRFELVEMPGGHMYLADAARPLLERIGADLSTSLEMVAGEA